MSGPSVAAGAWAAALAAFLVADYSLRVATGHRRPSPATEPDTRRLGQPTDRASRRSMSRPSPRIFRTVLRGRRRVPRPDPTAVAAWLDAIAASIRTGSSLRAALTASRLDGTADAQLEPLRRSLERGDRVGDAVTRWRDACGGDDSFAVAAMALTTAEEVGGSITRPLERSAAVLRQSAADADERRSWASQARLSATVMTTLPPAVLALLIVTGSGVSDALGTPIGAGVVAVGALLDAVGFLWMRRIVERAAR